MVATALFFTEDFYVDLLPLLIPPRGLVLREAVPAVDGPVAVGLEGDLRFLSAVGAGDLVHFAGRPVIATTPIVVSSVAHRYPFLGFTRRTWRRAGIGTGCILTLVHPMERSSTEGIPRYRIPYRYSDRRPPSLRIQDTSTGPLGPPSTRRSRPPGPFPGSEWIRVCTRTLGHRGANRKASRYAWSRGTRRTRCRDRAPSHRCSISSACIPTCLSSSGPGHPNGNLCTSCRSRGMLRSIPRRGPLHRVSFPSEPSVHESMQINNGRWP